jgi:hypothetical protein
MNLKRNIALLIAATVLGVLALSVASSYARNGADDPPGDDRGGLTPVSPVDDNGGGSGGSRSDDRVIRRGSCSGRSNWKLKAKHDDGRIEVELEVDQNRNGVPWRVRIRQNGALVVNTTRRTRAPSGSFSLERRLRDRAGSDRFVARATRRGETCRASLTL